MGLTRGIMSMAVEKYLCNWMTDVIL